METAATDLMVYANPQSGGLWYGPRAEGPSVLGARNGCKAAEGRLTIQQASNWLVRMGLEVVARGVGMG
jgi:hypothetical protein